MRYSESRLQGPAEILCEPSPPTPALLNDNALVPSLLVPPVEMGCSKPSAPQGAETPGQVLFPSPMGERAGQRRDVLTGGACPNGHTERDGPEGRCGLWGGAVGEK